MTSSNGTPSFCGVMAIVPALPVDTTIDRMALCLPPNAEQLKVQQDSYSLLVRGGHLISDDQIIAAVVGQPEWTDKRFATFAAERGHGAAVIAAYREHKSNFISVLSGEFAIFVADVENRKCALSTDRLGRHSVFFALLNNSLLFGTTATAVQAAFPETFTISPQSLYEYVYFHMVPAPASVFNGILKLQAAQQLEVLSPIHNRVVTYWLPPFSESSTSSIDDLGIELRETIRGAVNKSLDQNVTAAFLSGGLDSSTVAGMLAEARPGRAHTYSIGFSADGYDEMEYARITAKHFALQAHEYYVTPDDVAENLPIIAAAYDEPFGNSSAVPAYLCARRAAADGVQTMLAGDGGDELFAGNTRYAKQAIFELYWKVPVTARQYFVEPLATCLPRSVRPFSKLRSYVEQARIPLPDRLQTYNFLHRHSPHEVFSDEFLTQIHMDRPLQLQRDIYNRPRDATALNRMLYLDWQQTLADNDLRKVSRMCALAGVNVTYPLLDDRLVDLSCRIPSCWKLSKGRLRYFYKQAMSGFLPDAIIHKQKHGFGLPFGVWMKSDPILRDLCQQAIKALETRNIFQRDFLQSIFVLHDSTHAAYYGELVWILTVLEIWLQKHSGSA